MMLDYMTRCKAVSGSSLSSLYWGTDLSLDTIMAREGVAHKNQLAKLAGPAVSDMLCVDCSAAYVATSRTTANSDFQYHSNPYHPYRCKTCDQEHKRQKERRHYEAYKQKQARIEELKWMPYKGYLGTDEWSQKRRKVIERDDFKCRLCAAGGRLHVHHRTYARRGDEKLSDLVALCEDCHKLFHDHRQLAENGRAA